eukprot:718557-Pelagomonas_calceolata.AAC.6
MYRAAPGKGFSAMPYNCRAQRATPGTWNQCTGQPQARASQQCHNCKAQRATPGTWNQCTGQPQAKASRQCPITAGIKEQPLAPGASVQGNPRQEFGSKQDTRVQCKDHTVPASPQSPE